ncbi:MAG: hypothetical protein QM775_15860 [Pirellulales bacterium]
MKCSTRVERYGDSRQADRRWKYSAEAAVEFPQYTLDATWVTWIDRFFKLWCRNQWKRERYVAELPCGRCEFRPATLGAGSRS